MSSQQSKGLPWNLYTAAKNRLASSVETGANMLDRLSRTGGEDVQVRVAENEKASPKTLQFLSQHSNSDVRAAVAENASTSSALAQELAGDNDPDVRYAMASNAQTSAPLLELLAQDENPYVSTRAQRTQDRLRAEPSDARKEDTTLSGLLGMPKRAQMLIAYLLNRNSQECAYPWNW